MLNSRFTQKGLLLTSTVISLFCIGCSNNTLPNLSQTDATKVQSGQLNALKVQATELNGEVQVIVSTSPTSLPSGSASPIVSNPPTEKPTKRPCPPPPPPCNKKLDSVDKPLTEIMEVKADTNVAASPSPEGMEKPKDNQKKRPCPPPPPPCNVSEEVKIANTSTEENKKECPPRPLRTESQPSGQTNNNSDVSLEVKQGDAKLSPPPRGKKGEQRQDVSENKQQVRQQPPTNNQQNSQTQQPSTKK